MQVDVLSGFAHEDVLESARKIMQRAKANLTPSTQPTAILLGGQPGAGKTTIANLFMTKLDNNILFISGDDYRKLHPRFYQLREAYGDAALQQASRFSSSVAEELIQQAGTAGYNLIIEGTLRTKEVPQKTCALLRDKGYAVTLACMAVKPALSYASTLLRYELMYDRGTVPRFTPKEVHDTVVTEIHKNLNALVVDSGFQEITLWSRQGECLYNSVTDKEPPGTVLRRFQCDPFGQQELDDFIGTLLANKN